MRLVETERRALLSPGSSQKFSPNWTTGAILVGSHQVMRASTELPFHNPAVTNPRCETCAMKTLKPA
jgi:hypothetical protein